MSENKIDSAIIGNFDGTIVDFSVATQSLDSAADQKETTYINEKWSQQLGYYKTISELKSAIDAKAAWTMGKGFKSNEITEMSLGTIKGSGVDTFNSILENLIKVAEIGGDSFAEPVYDEEDILANLKPLNPEIMRIVANRQGIILRYEQIDRNTKNAVTTFNPEQIFHLSRGRIGDEIHGISVVDAVEQTMLARNEAIADYKKLLHRNVYPVRVWEIDTDDPVKVAAFQVKADKASTQGENIIIPKGAVSPPLVSGVAPNATLNPLPWINQLTQNFYQEVGVPQIIVGGAQEITEASAKIAYLAWEQTVEVMQLYIEEQVLSQLNLEINLEFPASLQNELLSDGRKDVENGVTSPEDTAVTNTGVQS